MWDFLRYSSDLVCCSIRSSCVLFWCHALYLAEQASASARTWSPSNRPRVKPALRTELLKQHVMTLKLTPRERHEQSLKNRQAVWLRKRPD